MTRRLARCANAQISLHPNERSSSGARDAYMGHPVLRLPKKQVLHVVQDDKRRTISRVARIPRSQKRDPGHPIPVVHAVTLQLSTFNFQRAPMPLIKATAFNLPQRRRPPLREAFCASRRRGEDYIVTPPLFFSSFLRSFSLRAPMALSLHSCALSRSALRAGSLPHSRSALRR